MSYTVDIKDGEKEICQRCKSTIAIKNDKEILFRKISLLYMNTSQNKVDLICKRCKNVTTIDISNREGRTIIAE